MSADEPAESPGAPPETSDHPSTPPPPTAPAALPAEPVGMREDQVQNAVAFLSHPKVRGSSSASKRSFLERKGLTAEEIDQAFRRVPESATPAAISPPAAAAPLAQQPALQSTLQHLQPAPLQQGVVQPGGPYQQALVPAAPVQQPLRWSQVALGAGFFAAGVYAVKQLVWPYVWDAYALWRERGREGSAEMGVRPPPRPKPALENGGAGELGPEAARAVAEAIQAQTAELRSALEAVRELVGELQVQQRKREEAAAAVAAGPPATSLPPTSVTVAELRAELQALGATLQESLAASPAKGGAAGSGAGGGGEAEGVERELSEIRGLLSSFLCSPDARSPSRSYSPEGRQGGAVSGAATALNFGSPLSGSLLASPPQQLDASALSGPEHPAAPSAEMAAGELQAGGRADAQQQLSQPSSSTSLASSAPSQPPHPPSYMEVLEMLEKGITPPNVRTDINDKPPNPQQPPPQPRLKPRPKPWERQQQRAAGEEFSAASISSTPCQGPAQGPGTQLVDSFGGPDWVVHTSSGASSSAIAGVLTGPAPQQAAAAAAVPEAAAGEEGSAGQGPGVGQGLQPDAMNAGWANGLAEAHAGEAGGSAPGQQVGAPGCNEALASEQQQQLKEEKAVWASPARPVSYRDAVLVGPTLNSKGPALAPLPTEAAEGASPVLSAHHRVLNAPPRHAASIYEAASAAAPSSPAVIAARHSPTSSPGASIVAPAMAASASSELPSAFALGAAVAPAGTNEGPLSNPLPQPSPPAAAAAASRTFWSGRSSPPGGALAAGGSLSSGGSTGPAGSGSSSSARDRRDGSGIARPLATGWRPPPIPVPTFLGAGCGGSGRASVGDREASAGPSE